MPIFIVADLPLMVVATADLPANSIKDLARLEKVKPGQLSYAPPGNGTLNHLMGELLKQTAQTQHVAHGCDCSRLNR